MSSGLVYVGKVRELSQIPDADRILSAEVDCGEGGIWRGVVGKEQFKQDDLCTVYLQDALVQPSKEMAFLERTRWRVKMARFRGVPSECVIMPGSQGEFGEDVTDKMGVTKYEKPTSNAGQNTSPGHSISNFPGFIPKTDEPNFQKCHRMMEELKYARSYWVATVKCDGMSTTAFRKGEKFGVCSRNMELAGIGESPMWDIAREYKLAARLPDGYAIQWETCGPKIQGNPMGLDKIQPFAFDVWDINNRQYLNHQQRTDFCEALGFPQAPVACGGKGFDYSHDDLIRLAEGKYPNGDQREGIVIRPTEEMRVQVGGYRVSFKVINLLYKD